MFHGDPLGAAARRLKTRYRAGPRINDRALQPSGPVFGLENVNLPDDGGEWRRHYEHCGCRCALAFRHRETNAENPIPACEARCGDQIENGDRYQFGIAVPTELFSCILCGGMIVATPRKIAMSGNSDRIQYIR